MLFEKIWMKKKMKWRSKKGNRKVSKFACKQILGYGVNTALRRGIKICMVNPSYTTRIARKTNKDLGSDVDIVSAYPLTLKFLSKDTFEKLRDLPYTPTIFHSISAATQTSSKRVWGVDDRAVENPMTNL